MKNHIVCIASEHKGNEFIEEAQNQGWDVTLVTRKKLLDSPWPWTALNAAKTVEDDALPVDYVRAVTNLAGSQSIHKVVGLDEFDVITAALAREHLQLPGMVSSFVRRFRDKLTMRNVATHGGILSPEYIGVLNADSVARFLDEVPPPWIVKPRNEVSAFGIRKCTSTDEVWAVLNDLDQRNTWRDHPSQFLIERFVEGKVFHVDSVVENGKVRCCGVSQYGRTPFDISHHGGVFTSSTVPYRSEDRKHLEILNRALLLAFGYDRGVSHAEFLKSDKDGQFYLLEVACRVGGAYIANVHDYASNFNLWREWARLETATAEKPYKPPKTRREYAGVCLALAKEDEPDTSSYDYAEIVYRIKKTKHVGMIFHSPKRQRVEELMTTYSQRIAADFLAVAPAKERYDD